MTLPAISEIAYFGKLPSRADFVRYNFSAASFHAIDDWIQSGLRFVLDAGIDGFGQVYEHSGTTSFVFHPHDGSDPVVGAIRPSRDSAGRKYPFFVGALCSDRAALTRHASSTPYVFRPLLLVAAELVDGAVQGQLSAQEVTESLRRLDPASIQSDEGVRHCEENLREVSFRAFCEYVWGEFEDPRKQAAFENLAHLLAPFRSGDPSQLTLGLQFPLASGDWLQASIAFWVESCRRLLARGDLEPTMFWNPDRSSGGAASMYVNFSRTPPSGFVQLFPVEHDDDTLFRIDQILPTRSPTGETDSGLEIPALTSEKASLWEVVESL